MKNYCVIRVLKEDNGQHCVVEYQLNEKIDADYIAACLNKQYATKQLNWVVDEYLIG